MRIIIALFRPWSVVHRYRSLMENARKRGYEVIGIGPKPNDRKEPMMEAVLGNTECWPVGKTKDILREKPPDMVYGEAINEPFELELQRWAAKNNIPAYVLEHGNFLGPPVCDRWPSRMKGIPHSTLLVPNKKRVAYCVKRGIKARAVGVPDLDLIKTHYDAAANKSRLGISGDERVIALFIGLWWRDWAHLQDDEEEVLRPFFETARAEGWHVLIHCHAGERVMPSSSGAEGLLFPERYPYLEKLQSWGGRFVTSFAPGAIGNIPFDLCDGYELMDMADCIVGSYRTLAWKAFAMGYRYIMIHNDSLKETEDAYPYQLPLLNVQDDEAPYDLIKAIVNGKESKVCKPAEHIIKTWYHALDGHCWERMLGVT